MKLILCTASNYRHLAVRLMTNRYFQFFSAGAAVLMCASAAYPLVNIVSSLSDGVSLSENTRRRCLSNQRRLVFTSFCVVAIILLTLMNKKIRPDLVLYLSINATLRARLLMFRQCFILFDGRNSECVPPNCL